MAFECMEDCIHLKACRRVQAIGRKYRLMVPRYCTPECTAYISREAGYYLTAHDAWLVAVDQYDGPRDPFDVYADCDFPSVSIGAVLDELETEADQARRARRLSDG